MTTSIKKFLLINLLLGVALTTSVAVVTNLFLGYKAIRPHLDAQLALEAFSIETFLVQDSAESSNIQTKINQLPELIKKLEYDYENFQGELDIILRSIYFEIRNDKDQLIAKSAQAPQIKSTKKNGFNYQEMDNKRWRIFHSTNKQTGMQITVMQPHDLRVELERRVNLTSIIIMMLTYPLLGVFIWILIDRGLNSIRHTTYELKNRAPNRLDPINIEQVPIEIKPLVEELNLLFHKLETTLNREKRFAGDAAHELKTPLAALKTQAQVAIQQKDAAKIKNTLEKVSGAVDRCNHVVDQLLTLSRTMPDTVIKTPEPLALITIISDIAAELTPSALDKKIKISLSSDDNLSNIPGNKIAIGILIRNLIDNAIRYSPTNSSINLNIKKTAKHQAFSITDEGPGIAKELQKTVFERFYRIIGTKTSGSGLGLSIVKQIAEFHQARISLKTPKNGKGLEVCIHFKQSLDIDK